MSIQSIGMTDSYVYWRDYAWITITLSGAIEFKNKGKSLNKTGLPKELSSCVFFLSSSSPSPPVLGKGEGKCLFNSLEKA